MEAGFAMTRQRRMILDALRSVDTHPSADQIYEMVRKRLPRVSLGTVYRNLELLHKAGLIQKLDGNTCKHYDGDTARHCHFRCEGCDQVIDISTQVRVNESEVAAEIPGFKLDGYRVDFFGLCPVCRTKATHKDGNAAK